MLIKVSPRGTIRSGYGIELVDGWTLGSMFKVECNIRSCGSTNSIGIQWTRNCVTKQEVLIRCISYRTGGFSGTGGHVLSHVRSR